MFIFSGANHASSGHEHGDACSHAVEHYNQVSDKLSTDLGNSIDSVFSHGHDSVSAGQLIADTARASAAEHAMDVACNNSGD